MEHNEGTFRGFGALDLYDQSWRPAGAPRGSVAIVHGFGEHSGRYMNVVNCLVPNGYAVYSFDHRGHGRSPGQRGHINSWTEFREDVRAFLKMVAGQEPQRPLFLMGHSLGGLIVLEYALRYPKEDGLKGVVASSPLLVQPGTSPVLLMLSGIMSRLVPTLSINAGLDAASISRNPAVVDAYRQDPLVHGRATPRFATEFTAAQKWSLAHASEFQLPLLMILGSADRLVPPQGGREFFGKVAIADKTMHEYAGAYHECHNDIIYEQTVAELKDWFDAHT